MHRGAHAREPFEESQAVGAQLGGPPLADVDGRMHGSQGAQPSRVS